MAQAQLQTAPAATFVWSRRLNVAAITCVLEFARAHELTVTGYASVMSLNPFGPPDTIRSVALVSHDGRDLRGEALHLRAFIVDNIVAMAGQASANRAPFRIDERGFDATSLLSIKVGDDQLVTLTGKALGPLDALWRAPIHHDGKVWSLVQYTPACLRSQLLFNGAFTLVQYLDGFIAERCLWGITDGLVSKPPWVASMEYEAHSGEMPYAHNEKDTNTNEDGDDGDGDGDGDEGNEDNHLYGTGGHNARSDDDDGDDDGRHKLYTESHVPKAPKRMEELTVSQTVDFADEAWSVAVRWADRLLDEPSVDFILPYLPVFVPAKDLVQTHAHARRLHLRDGVEPIRAFFSTDAPCVFLALVFLGEPDYF